MYILLIFNIVFSSLVYLYLKKKTRMNIKYLFFDNLIVGLSSFGLVCKLDRYIYIALPLSVVFVLGLTYSLIMLRFWRNPKRKVVAGDSEIVSPADGNIIYIKKIDSNEIPVSIKEHSISKLSELTKTDLLKTPCWLIGINMTPFDVHKNCSPIEGKVVLNKHFNGKYLSLKDPSAQSENERNTYVIKNDDMQVGVVQIASKMVKRIDSYVSENTFVKKGQWLGMIRFGSQVDLILPAECRLNVQEGEQVYAIKTIIAKSL